MNKETILKKLEYVVDKAIENEYANYEELRNAIIMLYNDIAISDHINKWFDILKR